MLLTIISAANIKHNPKGTSYRAASLAGEIAKSLCPDLEIDIVPLVDYELTPCTGCGYCYKAKKCHQGDDFNQLHQRINQADALIIVSAHYAPIPAKLTMLLEKMEQLAFLPRFHDDQNRSHLYQKPAGIIAHGGGTEDIMGGYQVVVLRTIANALAYPIDMDVIRLGEDKVPGVIFPVGRVSKDKSSPFPQQYYDWLDIQARITPLVQEVVQRIK